jgi:hypothetical protein
MIPEFPTKVAISRFVFAYSKTTDGSEVPPFKR